MNKITEVLGEGLEVAPQAVALDEEVEDRIRVLLALKKEFTDEFLIIELLLRHEEKDVDELE